MSDPLEGHDEFPPWILFDSLKPLVKSLRAQKVVLRRTSSSTSEWTRPAVGQLVSLFNVLGIHVHNETDSTTDSLSNGRHYILMHGGEGAGKERGASMYAHLPPNRLVILVKSKRVLALEGLSSKDHVRIKIDFRNQESMQEVVRRIVVLLGAQRVMAASYDCVKWNEIPEMVVVKKERNVSLGLSITTRQVDPSNHCKQIVLIKRIERPDGKLDRLKRYMHIQSVNGILLDDLDCEAASKKIRDISEGQVFLMVRAAHRDNEKAASSPMVTPLNGPPSLPPPPCIWKGVCRFNANPFMLTWLQKEVLVMVRPNQVQLIPALIMEPKEAPRKVAIVSYISRDVRDLPTADPRGHLVVAISEQSALGKGPDFVMKMINHHKEGGVALTLYLCQDGPKHLAEQTYSDYITNLQSRRRSEEEEDLGFEDPEEQMLNPVVPSNHPYSPVYITGSSRSDSSRLYQMMTRGESTAVHPTPCSDSNHCGSTQRHFANGLAQKDEPITLETPSPASECNLFAEQRAGQRADREQLRLLPQATSEASLLSPNSPVTVDAGGSGSDSSSVTSLKSMESGHSGSLVMPRPTPALLSSQLFDLKWNPVSTASMTSQDGRLCATPLCKYMLQNLDCRKLEEAKLSLCPSLELLYVKPNTICVYTINMKQLSTTPYEVFSEMCDFLGLFQSLRKPAGMQVILATVYDSTTEYGKNIRPELVDWFCKEIPMALKSKFNEILHEDDTDCIEVVPVDLAGCEGSTRQMQAAISECVNRYYQRLEGIDKDTEKMPLQQWPLFRQKVVELACQYPVVAREDLVNLARQFLWIEGGELFKHCLTALEQSTSLWVCPGSLDMRNDGFLMNPDVVIGIISRLADPEARKRIRALKGKAAAELCSHGFATQNALQMMMEDTQLDHQAPSLLQWMQNMGLLFEGSGAAVRHLCYFIPSITTSVQWKEAHGQELPDFCEGSAELFIQLCDPAAETPPIPALFFYQFVAHIISTQHIDASNLRVSPGCTRVKISGLKLTSFMQCEAMLSYDRLQCIIRIQLQPWQGAIIPAAHDYFRKVLQACEKYGWNGMAEAIMGPAFHHRYAESNARCAKLFNFLNEALAQAVPNSPATFVVNADSLKAMSVRGIEPQLHIRNIQDGSYRPFKVSEILGLNQWIYDPTLLYETTEGDVNRMKAMNKVAEWLLQDPAVCAYIACENGIIHAQDPEAHNWSTNSGRLPAGYRLIQQWHARKLPISRLRDALIKHHHNAAAKALQPFCDGMPHTEV